MIIGLVYVHATPDRGLHECIRDLWTLATDIDHFAGQPEVA